MTGRSRAEGAKKRTNYSSFPRVTAGFAIIHSLAYILAAAATAAGGFLERSLGQKIATGAVASVLLVLSLLLLVVLVRFRKVEIIPISKTGEMNRWNKERRNSVGRRASLVAEAKASGRKDFSNIPEAHVGWRPLILGNPLSIYRRVNILELGSLTRWTEIRKRNRLVDEGAHAHLNRRAIGLARDEIGRRGNEFMEDIQHGGEMLGRVISNISRRSGRSTRSAQSYDDSNLRANDIELRDLNSASAPTGGVTGQQGKGSGEDIGAHNETEDASIIHAPPAMYGMVPVETHANTAGFGGHSGGHTLENSTETIEEIDFEDVDLEDGRVLQTPTPVPAPTTGRTKSPNKQD